MTFEGPKTFRAKGPVGEGEIKAWKAANKRGIAGLAWAWDGATTLLQLDLYHTRYAHSQG